MLGPEAIDGIPSSGISVTSKVPPAPLPVEGQLPLIESLLPVTPRETLLADLVDHTSDLIQVIGVDGRLLLVNRAWCEALGYEEAEALRLNVFELIAPDCREHCQQVFAQLLGGDY